MLSDALSKVDSWGRKCQFGGNEKHQREWIQEMKGNIDSWHTFKSQVFSSQKAHVQMKSQVIGVKVQIEF